MKTFLKYFLILGLFASCNGMQADLQNEIQQERFATIRNFLSRSNVKTALKVLAVCAVAAGGYWLLQSNFAGVSADKVTVNSPTDCDWKEVRVEYPSSHASIFDRYFKKRGLVASVATGAAADDKAALGVIFEGEKKAYTPIFGAPYTSQISWVGFFTKHEGNCESVLNSHHAKNLVEKYGAVRCAEVSKTVYQELEAMKAKGILYIPLIDNAWLTANVKKHITNRSSLLSWLF